MGLTEQQILADVVTGLSSNISGDPGYWIDPKTNNAYFVVAQYPEQNLRRFEDFLLTPLLGQPLDASAISTHGDAETEGSARSLQNTAFAGMADIRSQDNFSSANEKESFLLKDVVEV